MISFASLCIEINLLKKNTSYTSRGNASTNVLQSSTMNHRPNILVVCGRNKKRSRTAESIFKNDSRFNIRSAGLSSQSDRKISEKDLNWADLVFVMETRYRARIWEQYKQIELPPIEILDIPDDYEFMDEELVVLLTDKINSTLRMNYEI